jgi:hypothetical protein
MRAIASKDGAEPANEEGRIGGATKQLNARNEFVDDLEHRSVPAQGIEHSQAGRTGEEANLAPPKIAAQRRPCKQQQRQRADVQHTHVLGNEKAGILPGEARRTPIVLHAAGRGEHVRCDQREQQRRV